MASVYEYEAGKRRPKGREFTDQELGELIRKGCAQPGFHEVRDRCIGWKNGRIAANPLGAAVIGLFDNAPFAVDAYKDMRDQYFARGMRFTGKAACAEILGISRKRADWLVGLHDWYDVFQVGENLVLGNFGSST